MKKRELKKLPEGMTVESMEEIFTDRLANLIVRLLDYRHEQKLKAKMTANENVQDENKN